MAPQTSQTPVYLPAEWRLIVHPPAEGAWNMAVDEALSESVSQGRSAPALRFYAWQPGCLSLGYAQPAADIDYNSLRAHGWHATRRLTGGRAILHIDEVTYSVITPLGDPRVEGGVVESYRRLSAGLLTGLALLGAEVHAGRAEQSSRQFDGPVCFEVPSDYEITAQGKKLLGSAQTRRMGVALQHGALPLSGDLSRICDALSFPSEEDRLASRARLLSRALTLESALGRPPDPSSVIDALARGFSRALNVILVESALTASELARANELASAKYASPEWISRH